MAFADPMPLRQRSAGLAGALIIPGALGALLITGLAVKEIVLPPKDDPVDTFDVKPPPPPEPPKATPAELTTIGPIVAPKPPLPMPVPNVKVETTPVIPDTFGEVVKLAFPPIDAGPAAMPSVKPAIATPRNDPGRWVTTSDYRTSWINRELTGSAQFELNVSASGKVTGCSITRSTGHGVLDEATCRLIMKRASFRPETDASGKAVAGTYSSSIRWVLPD